MFTPDKVQQQIVASIRQFVAVLLIGLVSGTYSSIFVAVPLVVAWFERDLWGRKHRTVTVAAPAGK